MIINKDVLKKVRETPEIRQELVYRLKISDQTYYRYLNANRPNGELTKLIVIKTIAMKLGIPEEMVIDY